MAERTSSISEPSRPPRWLRSLFSAENAPEENERTQASLSFRDRFAAVSNFRERFAAVSSFRDCFAAVSRLRDPLADVPIIGFLRIFTYTSGVNAGFMVAAVSYWTDAPTANNVATSLTASITTTLGGHLGNWFARNFRGSGAFANSSDRWLPVRGIPTDVLARTTFYTFAVASGFLVARISRFTHGGDVTTLATSFTAGVTTTVAGVLGNWWGEAYAAILPEDSTTNDESQVETEPSFALCIAVVCFLRVVAATCNTITKHVLAMSPLDA